MKFIKYISFMPVCIMAMTSCSDELSGTDWTEGEVSPAPGVYFSPDNETFMALLDGDGTIASLKVQRIDCKGELNVPVVIKNADPNMVVPKSIQFADGSYETTLDVDCAASPSITQLPLELTFPDEYINPYAAGSAEYSGSIIVSKWDNVSETGLTEFMITDWSYKDAGFDTFQSEMTHLAGSDRYRVKNFLGTGVDFTFELIPSPYKEDTYRIVPISNQLLLSDYGWGDYAYYNSWWLITDDFYSDDEDAEGWPDVVLTKQGDVSSTIYYIQFLWYDEGTKAEYCYVINRDKGTPTAYMAFYGNLDEDMNTYAPYRRVRFAWTENNAD